MILRKEGASNQILLKQIIEEKWLTANAVISLLPANSIGDSVVIYDKDNTAKELGTYHFLLQFSLLLVKTASRPPLAGR